MVGQPGGPVEVGIVSSGSDCNPSRPDVFTRADSISAGADSWVAYAAETLGVAFRQTCRGTRSRPGVCAPRRRGSCAR